MWICHQVTEHLFYGIINFGRCISIIFFHVHFSPWDDPELVLFISLLHSFSPVDICRVPAVFLSGQILSRILLRVQQQTSFLSCSCNYWYISSLIAMWCIYPMSNIHYTKHYRYHIPETHWVKDEGSCWSPQWQKPLPEQSGSSLYLTCTEDTRIFKGAVFWMSTISHIFTTLSSDDEIDEVSGTFKSLSTAERSLSVETSL